MDPQTHIRGQALMEALRYDDAIRELKEALRDDPQDARALYLIGHCHLVMGREEEARHFAQEAIAIEPNASEFHVLLAHAVLNMHQTGTAIAHTDAALRIDPEDTEAHFIRAAALFTAGRKQESLGSLNATLRIDPEHERALTLKARVLRADAYHMRADETLAAALRIDPNNAHTLAVKAWGDFVHQRHADHERAFREVLALAPFNKLARRGLVLSTAPFAKRLAEREQRAEEGPIVDEETIWPRLSFYLAVIVPVTCFVASRSAPEFIAFGGMLYLVLIAFFIETWPCLLLLPVLLRRETRELLPEREAIITLVADLLVLSGTVWCAIAPAMKGVHSIWGLTAVMTGTLMLNFRFKERTSPRQWLRWAYMGALVALVITTMILEKPHGYWTSTAVLIGALSWFRVHLALDKK